MLSLPEKDNQSSLYHTLLVRSKYVGLTRDRKFYVTLDDLSTCKDYDSKRYVCKSLIIHDENADPICETSILHQDKEKYNQLCNIMTTKGNFKIIHRLTRNKWLLLYTDPINIVEGCGKKFSTTKLEGAGVLTLNEQCTATLQSTKIHGEGEIETKLKLPEMKIDIIEQIYNHPQVKNLPDIEIKPVNYNHAKLNDLKAEAQQMADINQELSRVNYKNDGFNQQHSILLYIISICVIGYIIYRCCCIAYEIAPAQCCHSLRCPGRRRRQTEDIEMQEPHNSREISHEEPQYSSIMRRIPEEL